MALLVFVGPAVPLLPGGCPPALAIASQTTSLCIDAPAAVVDARAPPWAPLRSKPRTDERRDADAAAPRRTSFVANAAALVGPAVVRVDVERGEGRPEYSHASGFVYDGHNALVLTNAHVVQGATRVAVVTAEGDRKDARVLGVDAHTDLAVLKVADARHLPEAELGDDDALRVGDWVVAIGHPIGLDHTVTLGIVSSKGRSIASPVMSRRDDESGARRWADRVRFIQTDAAINPGNSGGPLLDDAGRVIGINTATAMHADGIGFAIPVTVAKRVASDLAAGRRARHAYLGVELSPLTPETRRLVRDEAGDAVKLPDRGALVMRVVPGSPAAAAGLRRHDVLVTVAGAPVRDVATVLVAVEEANVGDSLSLGLRRGGGREQNVAVTTANLDDFSDPLDAPPPAKKPIPAAGRDGVGRLGGYVRRFS